MKRIKAVASSLLACLVVSIVIGAPQSGPPLPGGGQATMPAPHIVIEQPEDLTDISGPQQGSGTAAAVSNTYSIVAIWGVRPSGSNIKTLTATTVDENWYSDPAGSGLWLSDWYESVSFSLPTTGTGTWSLSVAIKKPNGVVVDQDSHGGTYSN